MRIDMIESDLMIDYLRKQKDLDFNNKKGWILKRDSELCSLLVGDISIEKPDSSNLYRSSIKK